MFPATVEEVGDLYGASIELSIRTELQSAEDDPKVVKALTAYFDEYDKPKSLDEVKWWDRKGTQEFDYGYAITVHKAQGSQWESVLLLDDKFLVWKRPDRAKWLYTAITRAAESITVVS